MDNLHSIPQERPLLVNVPQIALDSIRGFLGYYRNRYYARLTLTQGGDYIISWRDRDHDRWSTFPRPDTTSGMDWAQRLHNSSTVRQFAPSEQDTFVEIRYE